MAYVLWDLATNIYVVKGDGLYLIYAVLNLDYYIWAFFSPRLVYIDHCLVT